MSEEKKKPFLVIAHPKRNDYVPHWLHQATLEAMTKPCPYCHIYEGHIFDIGKSRQRLTEVFLSMPEATHLLFVDDDIIIPIRDSLMYMWDFMEKTGESIVSGLFYRRTPPQYPLLIACEEIEGKIHFNFPCGMTAPRNKLVKVGATGGGLLLIKREVFEKVEPPWFVYGDEELTNKQSVHNKATAGDELAGEDIYFSLKARKVGYKIWVDTRADLIHYVPGFIGNPELINSLLQLQSVSLPRQLAEIRKEYLDRGKARDERTEYDGQIELKQNGVETRH